MCVLKNKLESVTEQLKKKSDYAEELQTMVRLTTTMTSLTRPLLHHYTRLYRVIFRNIQLHVSFFFSSQNGKDLVQEVAKLRRSLDDAEGLSRDTKKEWAILRSHNLSLEESVVSLS